MMRAVLLACLLMWVSVAHANDWWDRLWHNADQRGEQLLQQGKAAAAARTYTDPRRKAYAELQAGDYQTAARDFTAYDDTTSNYNRGNALAMAGQLPAAIKAYDAALASDPKNADAKHNRDLVMQALQKQPPQSNSSAGKKSESGNDKHGNKDAQQNKSDGNQNNSQPKSAGNNPSPSAANKQQTQPKPGNDKSGNAQQPAQPQPQPAKPSGNAATQNAPQPSPHPQQSSPQGPPQAAQPAQSAADKPSTPGKPSPATSAALPGKEKPAAKNQAASADVPTTEHQLAEDQWLKSIPDDPGGLLRRKFMIEHLMRQQGISP